MARVFSLGFELGNPVNDLTTMPSGILVTPGLAGSLYCVSGITSGYYPNPLTIWTKTIPALSEFYFAQHFQTDGGEGYVGTASLIYDKVVGWYYNSTLLGYIGFLPASRLWAAHVGSTDIAHSVSPNVVPINTVIRMDVHVKLADSEGRIRVWIDGLLVLDYTGDTKPGADTTVNLLIATTGGTPAYGCPVFKYDNLMLNDTTGEVDNGIIGERRIIALMPNANGTYSQWTPSAAVDHYTLVDERPADNDTTYNEGITDGHKDTYSLANSNLADVDISRVWVELTAKVSGASTNQISPVLISGASENVDAAQALPISYGRIVGPDYITDPNTGLPWTVAALDVLEAGAQAVI